MTEKRTLPSDTAGGPPPLVSILIPMYGAGAYIREAAESVYKQMDTLQDRMIGCEGPLVELIVVDDGSGDGSADEAERVLEEAPDGLETRLVRMPHRGQAASRNTALSLARGRWIYFLDADDVMTDGALAALLERAGAEPETPVFCSRCVDFISPELSAEEAAGLLARCEPYHRMLSGCLLIRRDIYERVGPYDETLPSSETAQWMLRLTDLGIPVCKIDAITLRRRYHQNNFGRRARDVQKKSYMAIIKQRVKNNEKKSG